MTLLSFILSRTGSQRLAQESPPYHPRSILLGRTVKGAWSYSNLGMVGPALQGVPDPHLLVHSKETTKASKGESAIPALGRLRREDQNSSSNKRKYEPRVS